MKTNFSIVLVSLATSAIVNAIPLPQPNYDPTLQIPQSVFDFQKPNILTRSERPWSAGSEFVIADSEPNPSAPNPQHPPGNGGNDPLEIPTNGDNQEEVVPRKDSGLPFFSSPDDTTHRQPPDVNPSNGKSGEFDWLFDLLIPKAW